MMRSLFSGITGLRSFQTAMDVVGNNIANVNTPGFKASRITFQTTLSQLLKGGRAPTGPLGGINPMQIGLGVRVASIDKIMTQGSFQNTGKKTDLAIQGDGFFILTDGTMRYYTRAGNFDLDMNGNLIQVSTGFKVLGWKAIFDAASGRRYIDTNQPIGELQISAGMTLPAKKTTQMKMEGNLKSDVGFKSFQITLKDSSNVDHNLKVWFERGGQISSDSTNPFSDTQRYIFYVDGNGDGVPDYAGFTNMDKFGNVTSSGISSDVANGSQAATSDDTITINLGGNYSGYFAVVLEGGGDVIYKVEQINGNTVTINDDRISNGTTYNWKIIPVSETYTDPSGSHTLGTSVDVATGATLAITNNGQFKFYEADNPTNFVVPDYQPPKYTTSVLVYDTLGNSYQVYFEFVKLGYVDSTHKNVWIWKAYTPTGETIDYRSDENTVVSNALGGVINFDDTGRISDYGSIGDFDSSGTVETNDINWNGQVKYISFDASANGDSRVTVKVGLDEVTQFAGEFSAAASWQDGYPQGTLQSFAINEYGEIIGTFSNGLTDVLGKIALAVFNNPAGLNEIGQSLYVESPNSGIAKIGEPGTGGRGSLIPGALEMSNVDLAEEFTKMIIAQRGFQANARIITTSDQILAELVNIKR